MQLPATIADDLDRVGFCRIPGVLDPQEIRRLRATCREFFRARPHMRSNLGRNLPNAVAYLPQIHWVYEHPNVLRAFKAAFRDQKLLFTRHCDVAKNRLNNWHKDSKDYFSGDCIVADDCRVFKMALYLEEHQDDGHGLWVRPGSHRMRELDRGDPTHLSTSEGDAIIFDVRLTHSGPFPTPVEWVLREVRRRLPLKLDAKQDPEILVRANELHWKLARLPDRYSVFFTFGVDNDRTEEFARTNMERQNRFEALGGLARDDGDERALAARLAEAGVRTFGLGTAHT